MKQIVRTAVIVAAILAARETRASDVYAFRFAASSRTCGNGFSRINWSDDLVFHNATGQDAVIRLIAMTGGDGDRTPELTIPAGRTVSLINLFGIWQPFDGGL